MKALITGAAGFIGSQLAYKLHSLGWDLILIDNFSYGKEDNLKFSDYDFTPEVMRIDIRDRGAIERLLKNKGVDYIYNIAGIAPLPDCQSNPQEAVDVNVLGFVNILEVARKHGVTKVIQASTNAIYENAETFPTQESEETLPTLIYPVTKFSAERFAQSFADSYGMNVTCLRFANVYGPHIDCLRKQPPFVGYMIRELYYDRVPTFYSNGEQRRDYIYVDDLIELAILVRDSKGFDSVNVSSNRNYSVNELFNITKKLMGKNINAKFESSENFWSRYPELFEGAYTIALPVLHHEVNKQSLCDNSYAELAYGWRPKIGIEEGLSRVIAHQQKLFQSLDV